MHRSEKIIGIFKLRYILYGLFMVALLTGCANFFSPERPSEETPGETFFLKAQQLFDYGQYQQAIELWEHIPPSDPHYLDAQLGIRSARLQIEQIKDRQIISSQRLSKIDRYISEAQKLEQQGDLTEALLQYEEARLLDPKNVYLYNKIEELHVLLDDTLERHARLGDIYLAQGEYGKSQTEWERLLQLDPDNEKAKQRLADIEVLTATSDTVFVTRGRSLLEKGLLNAAKTEFEKARRVNPNNDFTATYLTKLDQIASTEYSVKKGDSLSSIALSFSGNSANFLILADFNMIDPNIPLEIGQTIKIPHILGFKNSLAPEGDDILMEENSSEIAPAITSRAIPSSETPKLEDNASLERTLNDGIIAFQAGKYREAVTLLQEVLLQEPDNEQAYNYFVQATDYVRSGAVESPAATYTASHPDIKEEAVTETEEEPLSQLQILLQTAHSYRQAGNFKKAIETFEQAYQLSPQDPQIIEELENARDELKQLITAYLNEGIKFFNQDALEAAILEWNKVLELDPSNRQAAEYKKRAELMLETIAQ